MAVSTMLSTATIVTVATFTQPTWPELSALAAIAVFGALSYRYKRGDYWKATAEERGARIDVLERVADEKESRNHELLAELAREKARPDMSAIQAALQEHAERVATTHGKLLQQGEATVAALGEVARVLESLRQLVDADLSRPR